MLLFDGLHVFPWVNPSVNNCNSYLIEGKEKILIDPGHKHLFGHVGDELKRMDINPKSIKLVLITHAHPDHIEGMVLFPGSKRAMHKEEYDFIKEIAPHYGEILGGGDFEPHILFQEGTLNVGDLGFHIIHTPGHSPGSICIYWPQKKALFTGDLVFAGGVGRTDLPGGDSEQLKQSIMKLIDLDIEYLLPGHGEILKGRSIIKANFSEIERVYFPLL